MSGEFATCPLDSPKDPEHNLSATTGHCVTSSPARQMIDWTLARGDSFGTHFWRACVRQWRDCKLDFEQLVCKWLVNRLVPLLQGPCESDDDQNQCEFIIALGLCCIVEAKGPSDGGQFAHSRALENWNVVSGRECSRLSQLEKSGDTK